MESGLWSIAAGWIGVLLGIVSGAIIGLFFHREDWMGGYGSYRRRLTRLGHIAFFGMGIMNLFFGLCAKTLSWPGDLVTAGGIGWIIALVGMPSICFLSAWRKPLRHLFAIPVIAALVGVICALLAVF